MKFNLNKILSEWAYRVDSGQPDISNVDHINHLREVLYNFGLPHAFIVEYVHGLTETQTYVDNSQNRSLNRVGKEWGSSGDVPLTSRSDTEKASTKDLEKLDTDSGKETPTEPPTAAASDKLIKDSSEKNKEVLDKISIEKSPKKKEAYKAEYMTNQLDNMLQVSSIESGAGRYNMSKEDVISYRTYLAKVMKDPNEPEKTIQKIKAEQVKKHGPISESDIDGFIEELEASSKSGDPNFEKNIKSKVRGKGGPGSSFTTGEAGAERYRNVIQAYLETGGISPITGKVVPFSECQLDHIVSLGNKGKDEPSNWMFMEERFNQFKGKKTDEDIRADLEEDFYLTDAEISAGLESSKVNNALKAEDRAFWKNRFDKVKGSDDPRESGLSKSQIEKMSKPELANLVYGWNLSNPDNELSRYPTPRVDVNGKQLAFARGEGGDNPVQPIEGDPSTYGLSIDDDKNVNQDKSMDFEASMKAFKNNRSSGGREKNKDQYIEMILEEGLSSDSTELDALFEAKITEHRTGQLKRNKAIKAKIKAAENAPGSKASKDTKVRATMRGWIGDNPEPFGRKDPNFISDARKRAKLPAWQEWKVKKDTYRYQQWSQFSEDTQ